MGGFHGREYADDPAVDRSTRESDDHGFRIVVSKAFPLHSALAGLRKSLRKEVIQPQVLLRLPCYDFVPVTTLAVGTPEMR